MKLDYGSNGSSSSLLGEAQALEAEQQYLLEDGVNSAVYDETLSAYIQSKFTQVSNVEDRLEAILNDQQVRLQKHLSSQPGILSLPSTRIAWQAKLAQCESRISVLNNRLESVREIKEGMALHSPRIEELAVRKLRFENPELAKSYDEELKFAREKAVLERTQSKTASLSNSKKNSLTQTLKLSD